MRKGSRLLAVLMAIVMMFSFNMPVMAEELPEEITLSESQDDQELEIVSENDDDELLPDEITTEDADEETVFEEEQDNQNEVGDYEDISEEVLNQLLEQAQKIEASFDEEASFTAGSRGSKKADVVFVIDTTGSMGDEIKAVKENLSAFVNYLAEKGITLRFGIITYRDITCDGMDSTQVFVSGISGSTWYTTASDTITALSGIGVGGGGDTPETPIDALGYLVDDVTYNWSSNATRCAIVLTDAGYKYNNRWGFPKNGSGAAAAMTEVAEELAKRNIVTSVITETGCYSEYSILTDITGGVLGNIKSNFLTVLQEMADNILNFASKEKIGVYFVPGYMGSQLYSDADDSTAWVGAKELATELVSYSLTRDKKDLILARDSQGGSGHVHADASKDEYGTLDTSKDILVYLRKNLDPDKYDVKFFPYDWLGDLNESVTELEQDVKASGYDKIILVTHSTGGLLGSAYVAKSDYNRAQIERVVLVAPPLYGTYTALEPLLYGMTGDMNRKFSNAVLVALALDCPEILPAGFALKYEVEKWIQGTLENTPTTYQLFPSVEYLRLMPQSYKMNNAVTNIDEYYSYIAADSHINSTLLNGNNRSHKYFREQALNGDVRTVLNQVDTTLIGNTNCKPTPTVAVATTNIFTGKVTIPEILYSDDGDGTVLGVSTLLKPVTGDVCDSIKRIDMKNSPNAKKLDHMGLISEKEGLEEIIAAVRGEEGPMAQAGEAPEWAENEIFTLDAADDAGMADYAKILMYNNQETYFEVVDRSGNVVAKANASEFEGFGDLTGFTYNDLTSDSANSMYQLQLPKGGYKINVYNSTDKAPASEIAVATMDRGGHRKTTATYKVNGFINKDTKLIAVIDLTAGLTDENADDLGGASGSGLGLEKTETANNDWELEEEEVLIEEIGDTRTLSLTGSDAAKVDLSKDINWESSDEKVVTVSAGTVKAVGYGDAYIYATANNGTGKIEVCHVTVGKYPTDVTIEDFTMVVGQGKKPEAVFAPADANMTQMTYTSANPGVVKVVNGSTLKAVGEGVTEVTGKTLNGLTAHFFVTVISSDALYVDEVSIDPAVAVLGKDQSSTVVARIIPETALDQNVTWAIRDEEIATFTVNEDQSCTLVGHKEGITELSAKSDDGSYTDSATVVVGNILDVDDVHQILMEPNDSKQLVLGKDGVYYPIYSVTSSDTSVVTSTSDGMLKAVGNGSALLTLTGRHKGKEVSAILQVRVKSKLTDNIREVKAVSSSVTSNIYRKTSGKIKVSVILNEDVKASSAVFAEASDEEKLSNIAMAIDSAEFEDADVKALFGLEPTSDNMLLVKPSMELTDAAIEGLEKSYESRVTVTINKKTYTTDARVKVVVDKTLPSIKADPVTLNPFYLESSEEMVFRTDCGDVTAISAEEGTVPAGLRVDAENIAIALEGTNAKSSNSFVINASTDEIRTMIPVKVVVKVKKSVPGVKLSKSSIRVYADASKNQGQQLSLLPKSKKSSLEDMNIAGITIVDPDNMTAAERKTYKVNDQYRLSNFDLLDGSFDISPVSTGGKSGTILLQVNFYGSKERVLLKLRASAVSKPSLKLSKSKFTFNPRFTGLSDSATITVNPADYDLRGLKVAVSKDGEATSDIAAAVRGGKLVVTPNKSYLKGTYKVRLYDGVIDKTVKVGFKSATVKVVTKVSGNADLVQTDSKAAVVTLTTKGVACDRNQLTATVGSVYKKVKIGRRRFRNEYVYEAFKVTNMGGGKVKLTVNPEGSSYKNGKFATGNYLVSLSVYAGSTYIGSRNALVKVTKGKARMNVNTTNIELTEANVTLPVPIVASFDNIKSENLDWKISGDATSFVVVNTLENGKYAITLDDAFVGQSKSGKLEIEAFLPGRTTAISKVTIKVTVVN